MHLNLVLQLLERDPAERLGCIEDREPIRQHPFFREINWTMLEARKLTPPYKPKVVCMLYTVTVNVCSWLLKYARTDRSTYLFDFSSVHTQIGRPIFLAFQGCMCISVDLSPWLPVQIGWPLFTSH